jgi:hypothetical protein
MDVWTTALLASKAAVMGMAIVPMDVGTTRVNARLLPIDSVLSALPMDPSVIALSELQIDTVPAMRDVSRPKGHGLQTLVPAPSVPICSLRPKHQRHHQMI